MAITAHYDHIRAPAARRPSFWRRFLEAAMAARQRQADREVAAFLSRYPETFNDAIEREAMQVALGRRSGAARPF